MCNGYKNGQGGLLSRHRGRGIEPLHLHALGGTLYLVGRDAKTHELLEETMPCSMCKRLIINAGITQVVVRTGSESHKVIHVRDWVFNDDSLPTGI